MDGCRGSATTLIPLFLPIPSLPGYTRSKLAGLNNSDVPSPYPAGAQLFFRTVTAIHESPFAFKIAFVLCDIAIIFLLFIMQHRAGNGEHWVLAYAWHPLLTTEVAASGHVDIVGVLLLVISAAALGRRWRVTAAITFALAVAVKFLPIVLVPLYWRRLRIRDGALAVVAFGLLYLPFLKGGRIPIGARARRRRHRDGSGGATASSETADAVVLVDRIDRVSDAIAIGRRSLLIARQSVLAGIGLSLARDGRRRASACCRRSAGRFCRRASTWQ